MMVGHLETTASSEGQIALTGHNYALHAMEGEAYHHGNFNNLERCVTMQDHAKAL